MWGPRGPWGSGVWPLIEHWLWTRRRGRTDCPCVCHRLREPRHSPEKPVRFSLGPPQPLPAPLSSQLWMSNGSAGLSRPLPLSHAPCPRPAPSSPPPHAASGGCHTRRRVRPSTICLCVIICQVQLVKPRPPPPNPARK